jgi:glyoxylase-like metal-dependent hydrolase (beta-lactamase superfamily II)
MKIVPLTKNPHTYSCNSYLLLGDWNKIGDVNVIVDPGTDDFIIPEIERLSTGFGKLPVDRIYLTHNHFDHAGSIETLKKRYGAKVFAYTDMAGVDDLFQDGSLYPAGDDFLEVFHTPGHSSDSICLYNHAKQIIFSGDMQLRVRTPGGAYTQRYLDSLLRLYAKPINTVFSGHDEPLSYRIKDMLRETIANVRKSEINQG